MLYSIENDTLRVIVSDYGAELTSIVGKSDGTEYMWQGSFRSWHKHSAILFPFCNKVFESRYTYLGHEYPMGTHGFASHLFFNVIEHKKDSITLELRENEYTLPVYPFRFFLRVTYELSNTKLINSFEVINTDEKTLHFTLGAHPGFRLPLLHNEDFSDYYIEFSDECRPKRAVSSLGFRSAGEYTDFPLKEDKYLELSHELFKKSTIFLSETSRELTVCSKKNDKKIKVAFFDFPYLQFWQPKRGEPEFLCVEPWCSQPPRPEVYEISTEPEFEHLRVGESFKKQLTIEITE